MTHNPVQPEQDLTAIKGIGPATRDTLHDLLNIQTPADLARMDAEQAEARLKDAGKIISGRQIQEWITAAQAMTSQNQPVTLKVGDSAATAARSLPPKRAVAFENPGIAFQHVQVFQPSGSATPVMIGSAGRPLHGAVTAQTPFDVELAFDITGLSKDRAITGSANFFAYTLTTDTVNTLGTAHRIEPLSGQSLYRVVLGAATLNAGMYRLQIVVQLSSDERSIMGYLEIPSFEVR